MSSDHETLDNCSSYTQMSSEMLKNLTQENAAECESPEVSESSSYEPSELAPEHSQNLEENCILDEKDHSFSLNTDLNYGLFSECSIDVGSNRDAPNMDPSNEVISEEEEISKLFSQCSLSSSLSSNEDSESQSFNSSTTNTETIPISPNPQSECSFKYSREQLLSLRSHKMNFDFKEAIQEFPMLFFNKNNKKGSKNRERRFPISKPPSSIVSNPGIAMSLAKFDEDTQLKLSPLFQSKRELFEMNWRINEELEFEEEEQDHRVLDEPKSREQQMAPTRSFSPPNQQYNHRIGQMRDHSPNEYHRGYVSRNHHGPFQNDVSFRETELRGLERARGGFANRRTHEPNSREQPKAPEYSEMNTRRSSPESEYRGMNAHAPSAQPPQSHPQEHPRNEYRGMNNADQSGQPQGYHTQNDYQPNEYRGMNQGQSSQPFGRHRASYDNLHQRERPDYQHNINRQSPPTFEHSERYGQPPHTHGQNQAPPYHHHEYRPNGNQQSLQYQSYPRSYQNGPDPQYAPPPPPQHNQQPYGSYNHPQQAAPPSSHWNGSDFNRGSQWGSHHNGNDGASAPYDPRRAVPRGVQRTNQGVSIFGQGFSNDEKRAIMKAAVAITNFIESQRQPVTDFILRDAHRNRYFETAFNMDPVDFVREHAQNINVEKLLVNGIWTNVYSVDC